GSSYGTACPRRVIAFTTRLSRIECFFILRGIPLIRLCCHGWCVLLNLLRLFCLLRHASPRYLSVNFVCARLPRSLRRVFLLLLPCLLLLAANAACQRLRSYAETYRPRARSFSIIRSSRIPASYAA